MPKAQPVTTRKPQYVPTDADRQKVRMMAGVAGLGRDIIGKIMGVSGDTILRHFAAELEIADAEATVKVAGSVFKTACDREHKDHMRAAEFWLRTRARWSTTDVLEVRAKIVANQSPMLASLSTLDLDQLRSLEQITAVLYESTQSTEEAAEEAEGPREVQATSRPTG